jgi:hypothetical protein
VAASLGLGPTTGGHQLQDGHAFGGRVVRASVRRQSSHAGILMRISPRGAKRPRSRGDRAQPRGARVGWGY